MNYNANLFQNKVLHPDSIFVDMARLRNENGK